MRPFFLLLALQALLGAGPGLAAGLAVGNGGQTGQASLKGEGNNVTVTGKVVYYTTVNAGAGIEVAAHPVMNQPPVTSVDVTGPAGSYQLTGLADGSYFISAFADLDGSGGPPDPGEPLVWYDDDGDGVADAISIVNQQPVNGVDLALGTIIYVDADAAGLDDGTSWENAYVSLTDGLGAATPDSEVWIAAGTYRPTDDTNRTRTFFLKNDVAVHGGFAGTEILRWPRDLLANRTVLSGEIGVPGLADNSYRVVGAVGTDASAILAHVTITGGNANGGFPNDQGGGLRVDNRFSSTAATGASIFNVLFVGNSAVFHGGGVAAQSASPTLVNCQFVGNSSGANGSGVASLNSFGAAPGNPLIVNASFSANSGPQGVVTSLDSSSLTLHNSIIWGNADAGTPVGDFGPGASTVTYSIVEGGYAGPGTEILDVDPLYADPDGADNVAGTADDDLVLQPGSPAVDAGDNTVLVADIADLDSDGDRSELVSLDLLGLPRRADDPLTMDSGTGSPPLVDLGAHERPTVDEIFADGFEEPTL